MYSERIPELLLDPGAPKLAKVEDPTILCVVEPLVEVSSFQLALIPPSHNVTIYPRLNAQNTCYFVIFHLIVKLEY